MINFDEFLHRLELLKWQPAGYMDPQVVELLNEVGRHSDLIFDAVSAWSAENLEKRQLSCHETATHYKWFVHYHDELRYKVWLHQYKPSAERAVGHAEVPHNHRYSLASVLLRGGFVHHRFEKTPAGLYELAHEQCSFSRGDTYTVDWQEFHKLSDLSDHTVTLVVESPVVRHFSEAFYGEGPAPRLFYDFVGLRTRLSREMALDDVLD
jgi:hypothetical protein